MNKLIKISLTAVVGLSVAAGLAACTTSDKAADKTTAPKPSDSTSTAPTTDGKAPATGVCQNGTLLITQAELKGDAYTLDKSCDTVAILTSKATITLKAPIKSISLEGSDNTIDAQGIGSIAVLGTGNTVKHTGAAPKVADTGHADDTKYEAK